MIFNDIINSIFIAFAILFAGESMIFTRRFHKEIGGGQGIYETIASHIPSYAGKLRFYYYALRIWALIVAAAVVICVLTTKDINAYLVLGIATVLGMILLCRASLFCKRAFAMLEEIEKFLMDVFERK